MLRTIVFTGLLLLLAAAAPAADLNGAWKGQFDFQGQPVPVTFNLKTAGEAITGTIEGMQPAPNEIKDGKRQGDALTFWVNTDYEGQTYKLVYKGKIAGDEIRFEFGTEDGSFSSTVVAKKV